MVKKVPELEILLDLHGEAFKLNNGYWTKFEVWEVVASEHMPHGIRYSLTLHNAANERILGYDNAHAFKSNSRGFRHKKSTWDHKHKQADVFAYEFTNAGTLLTDFWTDVENILKSETL